MSMWGLTLLSIRTKNVGYRERWTIRYNFKELGPMVLRSADNSNKEGEWVVENERSPVVW